MDLEDVYSEPYFEGQEYLSYSRGSKVHRRNFERKIRILSSSIEIPPCDWRILDLGCANGEFLETAINATGCKAIGADISIFAIESAKKRGLEAFLISDTRLQEAVGELKPNIIVAWDTWEHLEDPTLVFGHWIKSVDSLKYVSLSTVDCGALIPRNRKTKWRQFHPPSHLNYPTRQSFSMFFDSLDFQVKYQSNFGYTRPLAEYLRALAPQFKNRILKSDFLFHVPVYLNLYDAQLVIAERRVADSQGPSSL